MDEKRLINPEELEQILESNDHNHENPHGVEIDLAENIDCRTELWQSSYLDLDLTTELEAETFIRAFSISGPKDLDTITPGHLWQVYKKGKGLVWATLFEEGPELSFEVIDGSTIVKAFKVPYKDEIAAVWETAEPFRNYIRENIQKIYIAIEESGEEN